jgi:hypothetical protein
VESPVGVAEGGEDGEEKKRERDEVRAGAAVEPEDYGYGESANEKLLGPWKREDAHEGEQKGSAEQKEEAKDFEESRVT